MQDFPPTFIFFQILSLLSRSLFQISVWSSLEPLYTICNNNILWQDILQADYLLHEEPSPLPYLEAGSF